MEINTAQQGKNAKLSEFWSSIMIEINALKNSSEKHHDLPMARIKKIMKMDDSVQSCVCAGALSNSLDDWFRSPGCHCKSMRIVYSRVNAPGMVAYRR